MTSRTSRIDTLFAALDERILLLDGAMGTMIQARGLTEEQYRGDRFDDRGGLFFRIRLIAIPQGVPRILRRTTRSKHTRQASFHRNKIVLQLAVTDR